MTTLQVTKLLPHRWTYLVEPSAGGCQAHSFELCTVPVVCSHGPKHGTRILYMSDLITSASLLANGVEVSTVTQTPRRDAGSASQEGNDEGYSFLPPLDDRDDEDALHNNIALPFFKQPLDLTQLYHTRLEVVLRFNEAPLLSGINVLCNFDPLPLEQNMYVQNIQDDEFFYSFGRLVQSPKKYLFSS